MLGPVEVKTAHVLPRRVRLEVPALANRANEATRVAEALVTLPGVARAAVRIGTGSIVLESDGARLDAAALASEATRMVTSEIGDRVEPPCPPGTSRYRGPTRIARALAHAVAGINADVREALGGHADLGTLLPLVFASAGIAEVAVTRRLPVPAWFNLMWWSMRSFMTFNERAVVDEARSRRTWAPRALTGPRAQRAAASGRGRSRRPASGS